MIISLMNKKSITSIVLPEKIRGQYIIENSEGISLEAKSLLPQVPHLFQLLLLLSIYHFSEISISQ